VDSHRNPNHYQNLVSCGWLGLQPRVDLDSTAVRLLIVKDHYLGHSNVIC